MVFINKKTVIGLTGPSGCGKTIVALFLKQLGYVHLNCDEIVKNLYSNNLSLKSELKFNFSNVFDEEDKINKKKLSEMVFLDLKKKVS